MIDKKLAEEFLTVFGDNPIVRYLIDHCESSNVMPLNPPPPCNAYLWVTKHDGERALFSYERRSIVDQSGNPIINKNEKGIFTDLVLVSYICGTSFGLMPCTACDDRCQYSAIEKQPICGPCSLCNRIAGGWHCAKKLDIIDGICEKCRRTILK